jgi:hypothetical protein
MRRQRVRRERVTLGEWRDLPGGEGGRVRVGVGVEVGGHRVKGRVPPPVTLGSSGVDTQWLSGYSHNSTPAGASKNTIINQKLILITINN